MGSIYNVSKWTTSPSTFKKNDFVEDSATDGRYWYSLQDDNSGQTPAVGSTHWDGNINVTIDGSTTIQPYFFWAPSYNVQVSHQPRIQTIQFGDGYEQRLKDGINNDILKLNLSFESRGEQEAAAILHFLHTKGGYAPFYFKTTPPYSIIKKFVCKSFNSTFVFADNYNVTCSLEEVS
jgi:phage-related protein